MEEYIQNHEAQRQKITYLGMKSEGPVQLNN